MTIYRSPYHRSALELVVRTRAGEELFLVQDRVLLNLALLAVANTVADTDFPCVSRADIVPLFAACRALAERLLDGSMEDYAAYRAAVGQPLTALEQADFIAELAGARAMAFGEAGR